MIYVFGDSWAYGYGLPDRNKNFGSLIGQYYSQPVENYSVPASSMGHITYEVMKHAEKFEPGDKVIVILPPDVRWYQINNGHASSLFNGMELYEDWLEKHGTEEWFTYNHSMFIYTLINICKQKSDILEDVGLVLAHNYGKLNLHSYFPIDDYFLDKEHSLCYLLTGKEWWETNYDINIDNHMSVIKHPNFLPNDNHPNETGHKLIADMIVRRLENGLSQTN